MDLQASKVSVRGKTHIFVIPIYIIRLFLYPFAFLILHVFLRMEVRGRENILGLKDSRVIFAANHSSEIDPFAFQYTFSFFSKFVPLYFASLTKDYYKFSKYNLRSFCYGGLFFRFMGAYPVYKGLNNFEESLKHHIDILSANHPVLIFPEGEKRIGVPGKAHPGVIYLSKKVNAPVVPVKVSNTSSMNPWIIFLRKRKIRITFGTPIYPEQFYGELDSMSVEQLKNHASLLMEKILAL